MEFGELLRILKDGESDRVEFKSELSRGIQHDACAFANGEGGRIFIGVKDSGDPVGIKGYRIKHKISDLMQGLKPAPNFTIEDIPIASNNIIVVTINKNSLLTSVSNVVYVRLGTNNRPLSIEEIIEKYGESLRLFFDQISSKISSSALDKGLLGDYLKARKKTRGALIRGGIMENAEKLRAVIRKGNKFFLTNAGILCFTKDPQQYINNSGVRLVWFNDEQMKTYGEQKDFVGPLPKIVDEIEEFMVNKLKRVGGLAIGFRRQEFLEYPLVALREAIINAIIHRNYFDPGDTRIFIFPQKIEVKNPGAFPLGVSVDHPEHKPRNPILAKNFYDLGLSEGYGSGISKIKEEVRQHPFVDVDFIIKPYSTTVVFKKQMGGLIFDKDQQDILAILSEGKKRSGSIADSINLSKKTIIRRLNDLVGLGLVRVRGSGPQTFYELIRDK